MKKRNKLLLISIPLIIILTSLVIYQYGYLRVEDEISSVYEIRSVKTKTLEKYIHLISEKPELEKTLAQLKDIKKIEDLKLIEGQTLALSGALLQDMVKGIITARGGIIHSERIGKSEDFGSYKLINVSIDAVLPDARALSDVLHSIETRTPYLIIKELDIRVRDFGQPKELLVKMDVAGITARK